MAETPPVIGTIDIEHGLAPHKAQIVDSPVEHQRYAVAVTTDNGLQVEELTYDPQLIHEHPYRVAGTRTVVELDSFLAELARRPLTDTGTLWGNAHSGVLTAIYNDHHAEQAGWRDDKLTLSLVKDEYWQAWHKLSGQFHNQTDFGDLIEELLPTVVIPDHADLLEIIDSVRASTSGAFESRIERSNGGQKLTFKQEHNVSAGRTGQLEVPRTITLELKPWEGHPETYHVQADFRVRINGGNLALGIKLKATREIVRAAWTTLTTAVVEATQKPVYAMSS